MTLNASYTTSNFEIRKVITTVTIAPVGGSNPADTSDGGGPVPIGNFRGSLIDIEVYPANNPPGAVSRFSVRGGYGEYAGQSTQDFYFIPDTNEYCTVSQTAKNVINVTANLGVFPGPPTNFVYQFVFSPYQSLGHTIEETSGGTIGNNNLIVRITKYDF